MKTIAMIERGLDGTYGIYTPYLKSTIIGEGDTIREAKADFENSVREVLELFKPGEDKGEFENLEFEYRYADNMVEPRPISISTSKRRYGKV